MELYERYTSPRSAPAAGGTEAVMAPKAVRVVADAVAAKPAAAITVR